ncbi:hypothetical protein N5943_06800 [Pseudomonas mosselii]|nr:hypothetical protein [Pseudomonas mosselii]MCU9528374.1 hypothetical protein [Pseudomonas mosselii]
MSENRKQLTQASGITADLVLELGRHYSAKQMRSVQTGLTTAARELRSLTKHEDLLGRLGDRLSPEQRELLNDAARLLDSIKYNVEHAKERKDRVEKDLAKKRDLWERQAKQLVAAQFEMPMASVAEQLRILELYLVARIVLSQAVFLDDHTQLRKVMQEEPPTWSNQSIAQWRQSRVGSLMVDLRSALCDYLRWDLNITPAKRLAEVQLSMETRRAEILAKPQEIETVRIWSDSLSGAAFITSVLPPASPSK